MLKVIHCADIHLDSPFIMEDVLKAQARRNELRSAFSALMVKAKAEKADFVLIAGDLFDRRYVTPETTDIVINAFAANPDCKFIITPGNHDYYTPDCIYNAKKFPSNVYIFKDEKLKCISFGDVGGYKVNIYGYAFCSPVMDENPFADIRLAPSEEINILVAHGNMLNSTLSDCPISLGDIKLSGFDYIALGHIHNIPAIKREGNTWYGYSGSLEPRAFNDRGERGAFVVSMEKNLTEFSCTPRFVRLSRRIYAVEKLNLTGVENDAGILDATKKLLDDKGYGQDVLLRLIFEGDIPPTLKIPVDEVKKLCEKLYYTEVADTTSPAYDMEYLKNDPTIKGAFYQVLAPMLSSENKKEKEIAEKALRYGLSALNGNDIIDF